MDASTGACQGLIVVKSASVVSPRFFTHIPQALALVLPQRLSIFTTVKLWAGDKFLDSLNNGEPEKVSESCVATAYVLCGQVNEV